MKKSLRVFNVIALIVTIAVNYLSNARVFNEETVASVSASFPTLITPAHYAFSIWAIIYLALAAFVVYHLRSTADTDDAIQQIGGWFILSCFFNCCWVLAWIHGYIGWSVIIMLLLLVCLLRIVFRTNMELTDPPANTVVFLWWPFCFYLGWIILASVVNIAAWSVRQEWTPLGIHAAAWSVILLAGAGAAYLWLTWRRNMRETGGIGAWGLIAVGVADQSRAPLVAYVAWALAAVLLVSTAIHGYRNRKYGPFRQRTATN